MADLRAAARLFQVELNWPKQEPDKARSVWRDSVTGVYFAPRAVTPPSMPKSAQAPIKELPERPPIKNIVLDRLREAGTKGSKAAPIRQYIERVYDTKVHEKTVGMTLYRLSKEALVRRRGQTWFYVPQAAETENPGVGAPGSETAQS